MMEAEDGIYGGRDYSKILRDIGPIFLIKMFIVGIILARLIFSSLTVHVKKFHYVAINKLIRICGC